MKPRDNNWLQQLLDDIWDQHFNDVPQAGIVRIEFGRRAKNRLGSIKLHPQDSEVSIITINGLFRNPELPEVVVRATIVHELSHYAHGFNSPLQQKFRHPHAGGVMRSEFKQRGLEQLYLEQRRWLKDNWRQVVAKEFSASNRVKNSSVKRTTKIPRPFWFRES